MPPKIGCFGNFLVKISQDCYNDSINTQKTIDFLLEKLIRHTWIAILTADYVQVGQNIFWLQLERRHTWRLE